MRGDRIFTTDRARELAPRVGLKDAYLGESLYHLRRNNWIVSLRRGLYGLSPTVPGVAVAHEFEIAMALVGPAAISHWSALHYHGLTEQIPRDVFVLTTKGTWVPRLRKDMQGQNGGGYPVGDTTYRFVQIRPNRYFGTEKVWVGEARVSVTGFGADVARRAVHPPSTAATLLRCSTPSVQRWTVLNTERIAEYAVRLGVTTAKRLGWVLETQGVAGPEIDELATLPAKGYRPLDPTGPRKGPCNGRWMVQENLPGMIVGWRPLRTRLQEARRRLSIPWEVLERDYLLSWVLAGISRGASAPRHDSLQRRNCSPEVLLR